MLRSREGAWIEIAGAFPRIRLSAVAPVRERGLKYLLTSLVTYVIIRSREGAWIEIRPRAVAHLSSLIAPVRERGLKL